MIPKAFTTGVATPAGLSSVAAGVTAFIPTFIWQAWMRMVSKPFLLPQEDPETYYDRSVYSYNVPDFVNAPILLDTKVFEKRITSKERIQVQVGN